MASILTKKKSVVRKPIAYIGTGLILIMTGYLSFNYLNSVYNYIKVSLSNAITALKDFVSPLSSLKIPVNASTVVTAILLVLSTWFIVKGIKSLKHTVENSEVDRILSKLPNDYYIFNDINIDNNSIDHVVICPKGIFTIDTKHWKTTLKDSQKHIKQYEMIKQGILNSKVLNDFLQKNKVGNYFVNTVVVFTHWDEKIKENFSDVHVLQPEQITNDISTLPDKFSDDECKNIADALNISLRTQTEDTNKKDKQDADGTKRRTAHKA